MGFRRPSGLTQILAPDVSPYSRCALLQGRTTGGRICDRSKDLRRAAPGLRRSTLADRQVGSEVPEGLAPAQPGQVVASAVDVGPHPVGIDPSVLAQRPPDRLADEEVLAVQRPFEVGVEHV